jgi:hypothetical protein
MFGNFTEWGKTSTGGPKLKIEGKWVFPDRKANLDALEPPLYVEYETRQGGNDGKLTILNRIRPATPPPGQKPPAAVNAPVWDDSGMRFISNVVGSALAAGKLESPTDVRVWTLAARQGLLALREADDLDREPGSDDEPDDSAELEQMASAAAAKQRNW